MRRLEKLLFADYAETAIGRLRRDYYWQITQKLLLADYAETVFCRLRRKTGFYAFST